MRDYPIFTTDTGISSLVLREIPYKQIAYICIRDVQNVGFSDHLQECVGFCRMAGAERIYASGHSLLEGYPLADTILQMRGEPVLDPERIRNLFPVTEPTVSRWRQLYNDSMASVFNSRTLEGRDEKEIIASSGAYFVHDNGQLLGIGWIGEDQILAVASAVPGVGGDVMHTLLSLMEGASVSLEVAASNKRAIRLYEKLGFLTVGEISRWYDVTKPPSL